MFYLKQRKKRNERVATSSIAHKQPLCCDLGCMDSWKSYSRMCWPKGQRIEENFKWYSIAQVSENYSSIPVCWSGCAGEKCPSFPSRANVNKHHMVGEAGICPLPVLRKQLQPVSLLCVCDIIAKGTAGILRAKATLHFFGEASWEWTGAFQQVWVKEMVLWHQFTSTLL